ncbi:hypothetical protein FRB99_009059 [Tulasnella sp. 403]|nr:hypothetical protein FRB99_009059 [Tulasnella sp. 403]
MIALALHSKSQSTFHMSPLDGQPHDQRAFVHSVVSAKAREAYEMDKFAMNARLLLGNTTRSEGSRPQRAVGKERQYRRSPLALSAAEPSPSSSRSPSPPPPVKLVLRSASKTTAASAMTTHLPAAADASGRINPTRDPSKRASRRKRHLRPVPLLEPAPSLATLIPDLTPKAKQKYDKRPLHQKVLIHAFGTTPHGKQVIRLGAAKGMQTYLSETSPSDVQFAEKELMLRNDVSAKQQQQREEKAKRRISWSFSSGVSFPLKESSSNANRTKPTEKRERKHSFLRVLASMHLQM